MTGLLTHASGTVRRVLSLMAAPLLPDDYTQLINPLWSARELRGRIERVTRHGEDLVTLDITPGPGVDTDFEAGQYIGIGVLIDGRWTWRSYSLTNPPHTAGSTFTITVKAMPEGRLSTHLVDSIRSGTIIRLAAPAGEFHLPNPVPDALLFVTAGTGITPVMGMLRTLVRRAELEQVDLPDIVHIHSVRTRDGALFLDELEALTQRFPHYQLQLQETSTQGRFAAAQLPQRVPDYATRLAYACGPTALLDDLEELYASSEAELRTERFTLERDSAAEGGDITFSHARRSTCVDGTTTLLEAGEAAGVAMPFGCRMGICQSCVVEVEQGHTLNLRNGDIAGPGERVQACICVAHGPVTLAV